MKLYRYALAVAVAATGVISVITAPPAQAANAAPAVIPRITSWTGGTGSMSLTSASRVVVTSAQSGSTGIVSLGAAQSPRTLNQVASQLAADISTESGLTIPVAVGATPVAGDVVLSYAADSGLGTEGSQTVTTDRVRVSAQTSTGVFYAGRTLLQQLRLASGHRTLSQGTARDVPSQATRLVMLDVGRRYLPPARIKQIIRNMAWLKQNTLNLHFAEAEAFRLNSPAYPGLADPATSYTEQDIADIVAFGHSMHVSVMPGFEFPGHASVISDHFSIGSGDGTNACGSQYMHSHLTPDFVVDLTSATALSTVRSLLNEFIGWFDSPFVHIGGDEIPSQLGNCPRVSNYIASDTGLSTLGDLLNRWINQLDTTVRSHQRTTMVFNGFEHLSAPQVSVSSTVDVMVWEGNGSASSLSAYDKIQVGPYDSVFLTPNNYHNLYPKQSWLYDTWAPATSAKYLGSGLPIWYDYNFNAEETYVEAHARIPRAIMADRAWNASTTPDSVSQFISRVDAIGLPTGDTPLATPPRVNDGKPSHHWTFDGDPYPASHFPASAPGQTLWVKDNAGQLSGSSYIINNPTVVAGRKGNAFRFDDPGDGVGFGGSDVTAPWTYSVWVRRRANEADASLLTSSAGAIKLEQYGTSSAVGFTKFGTSDWSFGYSAPLNTWVNLTLVATPTTTTLYVNGAQQSVVNASIPLPKRSIGRPGKTLQGDLDEMMIFDEALSATQVQALYTSVTSAAPAR